MMRIPNRSIQAANIFFSSGAILLLIAGLIMENWVELIPKVRKDKVTHSPWLGCCPPFWPEESLEAIRRMMMMSLNISIYLNLIIGLQFTYMISQNKCVHLLIGFLSFFTGCLLFYAIIVYHHKLNKGQYVYFVNYKTKWIVFTIYLTIALFLTCVPFQLKCRLKTMKDATNDNGYLQFHTVHKQMCVHEILCTPHRK